MSPRLAASEQSAAAARALYLRLIKRCLTRDLFPDSRLDPNLELIHAFDAALRHVGRDWPTEAETMVGLARLDNVQNCIEGVITEGVPGDLVETGVWRGGCSILMRAVLRAYNITDRTVWLADSFQGLPIPDAEQYPQDRGDEHSNLTAYLGVSMDIVKENFRRYELFDCQVRFLPGWFRDTLPSAPIDRIAVLHLDGDMYESTYLALSSLYAKVSVGGFVIIDDYGALPNCRAAVDDFRDRHSIHEIIHEIDWTGVYWRRYM
jgi:O-methyltransferase